MDTFLSATYIMKDAIGGGEACVTVSNVSIQIFPCMPCYYITNVSSMSIDKDIVRKNEGTS